MEKIKVLNLIWSMGDGGAQRILLNYLKDFKDDKDIDFKLVVYDKCNKSYCNNIIKDNNYNVEYLNNKKSIFNIIPIFRKYFNLKTIRKTIKKAIEKYEPDIVHVHISSLLTFVLDPIIESNIPIRFDTLHSSPLRFKGKDLEYIRRAFQREGFIPICLNEEQKEVAKKHYGFKKSEIVRNGIDIEKINDLRISKNKARKKFGINEDAYIILGVGRLNKVKKFDLLIKSFNECLKENKNAELIIAGNGEEFQNLLNLVKDLNIEDKVHFLGNVDNITELYCAADVLGITSESESTSLVLLEAQVCKLHCVISDGVPDESIVTSKVKKLQKNSTPKDWAKALLDTKFKGKKVLDLKLYDVKNASQEIKQVYMKYWKEYHEKK